MSATGILSRLGYVLTQRQNAIFSHIPVCTKLKYFSNKPPDPIIVEGVPVSAVTQKKTKRPIIPKVTLISGNNEISVTTLEEAHKLATRRNLKLVKVVDLDTKTERPVYKLMTVAEYAAEDIKHKKEKKNSSGFKGEKILMMSSVITDHDLQTQIRKIEKWIDKDYEVRVAISAESGSSDRNEEVYKKMEDHLKDKARFLQKRAKGVDLKFNIVPPKRNFSTDASGGGNNNNL